MSGPGEGVEHRSLPEIIATTLREQIIDGELRQGARLVEQALAETLNVSRIPLREALAQLETEGLVTRLPRRGAVVNRLTVSSVDDLFDVRESLESLAAGLAARRADEAGLARLRVRLDTATRATEAKDPALIARANAEFHAEIVRLAGNALLASFMQPLASQRLWLFRVTGDIDPEVLCREHGHLYDVIASGDADAAAAYAREHVAGTRRHTLDVIAAARAHGVG